MAKTRSRPTKSGKKTAPARPITIGVDARTFYYTNSITRGVGQYTFYHLLNVAMLRPDWQFVLYGEFEQPSTELERFLKLPNVGFKALDDYRVGEIDLLHIPDPMNLAPGFDSPMRIFREHKTTVTFHDLIPLRIYWQNWAEVVPRESYLLRLEQLRKSQCVIFSNSEFTKRDLMKATGISAERITTIMAGLNQAEKTGDISAQKVRKLKQQFGIDKPFFLHVGSLDPHKNFNTVVRCFSHCRQSYPIQLVVVGQMANALKAYADYFAKKNIRDIIFTGYISRGDLEVLYHEAVALVFLSKYEGFGFPILEAMATGCPVITTNVASIPEVVGDAALLFNPTDVQGITEAMGNLLENPQKREILRKEGLLQSAKFSWEKTAEKTIAVWEELLGLCFSISNEQAMARVPGLSASHELKASRTKPISRDRSSRVYGKKKCTAQSNVERNIYHKGHSSSPSSSSELSSQGFTTNVSVLWYAPVFDPSGYADEARQFVFGLDSLGVPVRVVPLVWSDKQAELPSEEITRLKGLLTKPVRPSDGRFISVSHIFAPHFRRIPGAVYHVGRTMFETDRIPEDWVAACNQMNEIWVPSDFNVESFARSGVRRDKLVKIPEGIDIERYGLDAPLVPIEGRRDFNFLSVFDWTWRKGWDVLLRAFLEEFGTDEDVALILKVWSSYGRTMKQLQEEAVSFLRLAGLANELPPNVVFYQANLPVEQVPGLYQMADAFVLPTRGEGWGRPFMEAMLMELPVIGTRWSGQLEFMNDDNAYLIDCQEVDVPEPAWREVPTFRGHRWAEPSQTHLCQLMRQVLEDRHGARRKGQAARQHIVANFSRERVAQQVKEHLEVIAESLGARSEGRKTGQTRYVHITPRLTPLAVVWEGSQFVHHSLALINRELCLQLMDAGHELSIIPYEPDQFGPEADERFHQLMARVGVPLTRPADVHVRHQWPPNFTPPPEGHWVMIQPWEFGSLPKDWIKPMRDLVDELWVPSNYVRECYIRSGIPADKVFVVPDGVNTAKFRPDAPPLDLSTFPVQCKTFNVQPSTFKFLFVGGTIGRKGIDVLLRAYTQAFRRNDGVCLVIKDMGGRSFYQGQTFEQQIRRFQELPDAPSILYLDQDLPPDQLPSLYTACDCLAHPYRGEGFGLPIAEAMACGLPVIITNHGAALDFCDADTAYLIPAVETRLPERRIGDLETVDYPWLAEPDIEALARLMRHVYEHPDEARARGARASAHIRTAFTWERAAEKALARLQALREQPVQRHHRRPAQVPEEVQPLAQKGGFEEPGLKAETESSAFLYFERGNEYLTQGNLQAALDSYSLALQESPGFYEALLAHATTLARLGQVAKALRELNKVTVLYPDFPEPYNNLGCLNVQMGQLAEAEENFRKAVALRPEYAEAWKNLADLYVQQGFYAEAIKVYEELITKNPRDAEVLVSLGNCCYKLDLLEEAKGCYQQALQADPDNGDAQENLTFLLSLRDESTCCIDEKAM